MSDTPVYTDIHDKWADALTGYSAEVQPGNTVLVSGGVAAAPLMQALHRSIVRRGAHPIIVPVLPGLSTDLLTHGNDEQLTWLSPVEEYERLHADVNIRVLADTNTRALTGVDPSRQSLWQGARRELFTTYMKRASEGTLNWTLTLYPTDAYAQDAGMSTDEFRDFVYRACKLDQPDPVAAWLEVRDQQQRFIDWLQGRSEIHVTGPDTDLTLSVAGRTWINSHAERNFPGSEIFTGPVENSANGHVRFAYPAVLAGREVRDIRLTFRDGKVVEATAAENEEYLIRQLDTDEGARYLGEFAIGTNYGIDRFTKNILFDEKIGGTMHMAVGSGYPDTGSVARSAIHWDMIADMTQGQITADGEVFHKAGQFVI
jgi:aminopeptidase